MKCHEFFAIQMLVDGFGHDTTTIRCFETLETAEKYFEKLKNKFPCNEYVIVRQRFYQNYIEYWD